MSTNEKNELEKYQEVTNITIKSKSISSKSKKIADSMIREASVMYTNGEYIPALGILEKAMRLVPNEFRGYELTAMIHEELGNGSKSLNAYFLAAMLSNTKINNRFMWNKVYELAESVDDNRKMIAAIDKMYKKAPELSLLEKKLELLKSGPFEFYKEIITEIDMMNFKEIKMEIFDKLRDHNHKSSFVKISRHLMKLIKKCSRSHTPAFIEESIGVFYKTQEYKYVYKIYRDYYLEICDRIDENVKAKYLISNAHVNLKKNTNKKTGKRGRRADDDLNISEYEEGSKQQTDEKPIVVENNTNLKEFTENLSDEVNWTNINPVLLCDLIDFYIEVGEFTMAFDLVTEILRYNFHHSIRAKSAEVCIYLDRGDEACKIYTEILVDDPLNMEIKDKLHNLYTQKGHDGMAKQFKHISEIVKRDRITKNDLRYNKEQCEEFQQKYREIIQKGLENKNEPEDFTELLEGFFSNKFVLVEEKKYASFYDKNNRYACIDENIGALLMKDAGAGDFPKNALIKVDDLAISKAMVEKYVELSSLHGLNLNEWRHVLLMALRTYLTGNSINTDMAIELIRNTYRVKWWAKTINPFDLIGLKIALVTENIEFFVEIIQKLVGKTNYSVLNLHTFLIRFISNGINDDSNVRFLRSTQRFYLLRYEKRIQNAKKTKDDNLVSKVEDSSGNSEQNRETAYNTRLQLEIKEAPLFLTKEELESKYKHRTFLNTFLPRKCYISTVNRLNLNGTNTDWKTKMIYGIIYINNCSSRVLEDHVEFAMVGLRLVEEALEECQDIFVRNYNMGRAYQSLKMNKKAEECYMQCVGAPEKTIRQLAIYNLYRMWSKNKSKVFLKHLLSNYNKPR